jgi:hypothetical protein
MDTTDVMALIEFSAELTPQQGPSCPPVGSGGPGGLLGDTDCSGQVNVRDALQVLLALAHLPLLPSNCP